MSEPAKVVTPTNNAVKRAHNFIDISGRKFGRLLVVSQAPNKGKIAMWNCRCDCGTERAFVSANLRLGKSLSCGCLMVEINTRDNTAHGQRQTREYSIWTHMKTRCTNPNSQEFFRYGGRGISVCKRWLKFANFIADMGGCPAGGSIERKDNNGDYEPSNCKWATPTEQANNTRRNVFITAGGRTMTTAQWAKATGINRQTLQYRVAAGWDGEKIIHTPVSH